MARPQNLHVINSTKMATKRKFYLLPTFAFTPSFFSLTGLPERPPLGKVGTSVSFDDL